MPKQGRHPHNALSAKSVQALKAAGPRRIADGGGLYLLVAAGGSKSWILRTVVKGKRCDIGLGGVDVVPLGEAREEARRLRRIARAGGDPLAERRLARRTVPTFAVAAETVHKAHAASFRNEKHSKQWFSSLGAAIKTFGYKQVDAVTSADILAVLSPSWLKRRETSGRVLQRIRVIFEWCKAQGYCSGNNPTDGLKKVLPSELRETKHHAALAYPYVPSFIRDVRESDAREGVKLAMELTILCATRTSETLLARWPEVDFDTQTWTIPAERTKRRVTHRVPLSDRCIEILKAARAQSGGSAYVFPGRSPERPLSNMVFLMLLRRMGREDVTTHGFRSSFRDWAAERTNFSRQVCESALAHSLRDKTEAAYNRTDLFDLRRELMNTWTAFATAKPGDVVAMRA